MAVPRVNTSKPEHMSWTKEAWTSMGKFIFFMETNMSNGVGEHVFAFAYLSLLTGSICGWKLKLLQQLHEYAWSNFRWAIRLGRTTSVYGTWALVQRSRRGECSFSLFLFFHLYIYIYHSLIFFQPSFFYKFFYSKVELSLFHFFLFNSRWPLVWMELCSEIFTTLPHT